VVAGCPDDGREPVGQRAQGPSDVVDPFGDVTGDQQPVVVVAGPQPVDVRPVLRVGDVQVADRE
jgi:hypothetical protein